MNLFGWLNRKPDRPRVVLPLQVAEPPHWTSDDALNLRQFLNGPTGRKFRDVLYFDTYSQALRLHQESDFEQGMRKGQAKAIGNMIGLCDVEFYKTEEAPAE